MFPCKTHKCSKTRLRHAHCEYVACPATDLVTLASTHRVPLATLEARAEAEGWDAEREAVSEARVLREAAELADARQDVQRTASALAAACASDATDDALMAAGAAARDAIGRMCSAVTMLRIVAPK